MVAGAEIALHLICMGAGADTRIGTTSASVYGSNGRWANGSAYSRKANGFDDELEVKINGDQAQVRLPRQIVPKLHGGSGGWFGVKELVVGENEITGKVTMNFTNAPYLHIDRITGTVSVNGRDGTFSGQCKPFDQATQQRAF